MPITFTVDHAQRLVIVIVTGTVTREAVLGYFETQRKLEGLSYPRIVEIRGLDAQLSADDWHAATGWLRKMTGGTRLGPAAVVVDNEQTFELVRTISKLVADFCELEAFGDRDSAEEWLVERIAQPRESS